LLTARVRINCYDQHLTRPDLRLSSGPRWVAVLGLRRTDKAIPHCSEILRREFIDGYYKQEAYHIGKYYSKNMWFPNTF
jgi:hypothetical protein